MRPLASLPNGKEIWILSDSRSAIQHSSNWQSGRNNVGVSILTELKRLSTSHQIHLQWIPSQTDLEGNEIADTLTKADACEDARALKCARTVLLSRPRLLTSSSVPRAHQVGFSRRSLAGVGLSESSSRSHGSQGSRSRARARCCFYRVVGSSADGTNDLACKRVDVHYIRQRLKSSRWCGIEMRTWDAMASVSLLPSSYIPVPQNSENPSANSKIHKRDDYPQIVGRLW
ncbi:RNase H domain-containing protein [Trichonephila clavipes]|nr:RNase H domain-containing protein [Trichonephila clavipes]